MTRLVLIGIERGEHFGSLGWRLRLHHAELREPVQLCVLTHRWDGHPLHVQWAPDDAELRDDDRWTEGWPIADDELPDVVAERLEEELVRADLSTKLYTLAPRRERRRA